MSLEILELSKNFEIQKNQLSHKKSFSPKFSEKEIMIKPSLCSYDSNRFIAKNKKLKKSDLC